MAKIPTLIAAAESSLYPKPGYSGSKQISPYLNLIKKIFIPTKIVDFTQPECYRWGQWFWFSDRHRFSKDEIKELKKIRIQF